MLLMTELVGVPTITLGGQNDEEIIGNLVSLIGFGALGLALLYVLLRLYLPGALARKMVKLEARKAKEQEIGQSS
jgi:hypothetical protein